MEFGRVVWRLLAGHLILVGFYDLVIGGGEFGLESCDLGGNLFGAVFNNFPLKGCDRSDDLRSWCGREFFMLSWQLFY